MSGWQAVLVRAHSTGCYSEKTRQVDCSTGLSVCRKREGGTAWQGYNSDEANVSLKIRQDGSSSRRVLGPYLQLGSIATDHTRYVMSDASTSLKSVRVFHQTREDNTVYIIRQITTMISFVRAVR